MKKYDKSWKSRIDGDLSTSWAPLPKPMSLRIHENQKSEIYIAASLDFFKAPVADTTKTNKGSMYYKIEVNGTPIVEYHVASPRDKKRSIGVNLHAKTEVPAGENNIEVLYKLSKDGSWDLLRYQSERHLSVLASPTD